MPHAFQQQMRRPRVLQRVMHGQSGQRTLLDPADQCPAQPGRQMLLDAEEQLVAVTGRGSAAR
jgi:hypothetical protein